MTKKILCLAAVCIFVLAFLPASLIAQDEGTSVITGKVEIVSEDGMSIVVDGKTIATTPEFVEDYALAVGDKVEITVREENGVLSAVDCSFIFDEEETEVEVE
ncbi:MAG: hypothetical protein JW928_08600 [Candidatus Aureabacteria bacterium]|nr:hypothetical protein [Candidatus Auribacterota bacterium]